MNDPTRLLTISQAAKRLGISDQTLRAYADKGIVPVVKLPSGHRRFDPTTLDRIREEWESPGVMVQAAPDGEGAGDASPNGRGKHRREGSR